MAEYETPARVEVNRSGQVSVVVPGSEPRVVGWVDKFDHNGRPMSTWRAVNMNGFPSLRSARPAKKH